MAVLTIRNIADEIKVGIRVRAAQHGCSMEEEVRKILTSAIVGSQSSAPLGSRLQQRFVGLGEIQIPPRRAARVDSVLITTKKTRK